MPKTDIVETEKGESVYTTRARAILQRLKQNADHSRDPSVIISASYNAIHRLMTDNLSGKNTLKATRLWSEMVKLNPGFVKPEANVLKQAFLTNFASV